MNRERDARVSAPSHTNNHQHSSRNPNSSRVRDNPSQADTAAHSRCDRQGDFGGGVTNLGAT